MSAPTFTIPPWVRQIAARRAPSTTFAVIWDRLSKLQPGWLPDAPDEEKRARFARLVQAGMQLPLLANFIGWLVVPWITAVLINEFYINASAARRFITPYIPHDMKRSNLNWALLICWGSAIYSSGWAAAWFTGGDAVSFLAPLWLGTACIHGLTYFSNQRSQFFACTGAAAVICVLFPLFYAPNTLPAWCVLLGVGQFLFTAFLSFRDRHDLMRAVIRSRAESRAANQSNIAKSKFLATMSHELRTPLNAVIGYAEILEEDLASRGLDQGSDDAQRISRAARHLLGVINEILDLSKIEAGKVVLAPSPTDVAAVLREVGETTAHLARDNNNQLILDLAPTLGDIVLDSGRLRQCALNLVSNACKFTNDGEVRLTAWIDNEQRFRIDVKDTGCGIPEDKAAQLFHAFVQVDSSSTRKHEGSGLGLVITKRLAQLLGGDVSFVSETGKGSTFSMWLPATRAEPARIEEAA